LASTAGTWNVLAFSVQVYNNLYEMLRYLEWAGCCFHHRKIATFPSPHTDRSRVFQGERLASELAMGEKSISNKELELDEN
jgi:hypothetical protein